MKKNVELSDYSTFKIGGKARYLVKVGSKKELEEIIGKALKEKMPFFVLGGGSNTLISDKGFDGLAIIFKNEKPDIFLKKEEIIEVESSALLSFLVNRLDSFTGLEWAVGIPGTLGGEINGNAGAFG